MFSPQAKGIAMGSMQRSVGNVSPTNLGLLSPKTKYYEQNGTGRDTYIMCTSGGFHSQFPPIAHSDCHVRSLRSYSNSISQYQRDVNRLSKR